MNVLEDWINDVIAKPIGVLNEKYADNNIAREELEALFLPLTDRQSLDQMKVRKASRVPTTVLQELHHKMRNQPCEEEVWSAVIWYLHKPLPASLAHDLIDRWIATNMMEMTRQVDTVQWRLATFKEYALYTLIRERYQKPQYSVTQFEMMLKQYAAQDEDGILYMLSFYDTPSSEKKAIFMAAIKQLHKKLKKRKNKKLSSHIKHRIKEFLREEAKASRDLSTE